MSSISDHYSVPARAKARRPRIRDAESRLRARATDIPVMGPANRAPGTPIMGASSRTLDVMGGADACTLVNVMGRGDRGPHVDVFGESDLRFVDWLFTDLTTKEHKP
jgi:hypothetical protein